MGKIAEEPKSSRIRNASAVLSDAAWQCRLLTVFQVSPNCVENSGDGIVSALLESPERLSRYV
jgi:hypothetical protein